MNESARYVKIVEWSDEDQCFVGQCPGIIGPCCHGDDEAQVYAELCQIVDEWIALLKKEGKPLPPPTVEKTSERNFWKQLKARPHTITMIWESRLIHDDALAAYAKQPITNFQTRVAALIHQQLATWPMLRNATDALDQVQYKELNVNGARVLAQFNPARIVSTAAKVDAASIQARPCFLCAENLPAEEKGIAFGEHYVVLCNPFPVLKNHLVISERRHTPQAIASRVDDLLDLTQALGSEYFTLYNGPACGASAPDHHHFQACSRAGIPLFADINRWSRTHISAPAELEVFSLTEYRLQLLVASSAKKDKISAWLQATIIDIANVTAVTAEPLLNLLVTYDPHQWTVYLFPRAKHRPACYYAAGDEKLTISPAGIDLTGILVVPDPNHFARLTATDVERIYAEVTLDLN